MRAREAKSHAADCVITLYIKVYMSITEKTSKGIMWYIFACQIMDPTTRHIYEHNCHWRTEISKLDAWTLKSNKRGAEFTIKSIEQSSDTACSTSKYSDKPVAMKINSDWTAHSVFMVCVRFYTLLYKEIM